MTRSGNESAQTARVSPSRLAAGHWCHQSNRTIGEGDIYRAYSADCIADSSRIRTPFFYQGSWWVTVSVHYPDRACVAYKLRSADRFDGTPVSHREKTAGATTSSARSDPTGFYHGMIVIWRGAAHVLTGPPCRFVPGNPEPQQQELFAGGDL